MEYTHFFIEELGREAAITRKALMQVPGDKFDWAPHEKSTKLGTLAAHIATLPAFVVVIATTESLDMANFQRPATPATPAELLAAFDAGIERAKSALEGVDNSTFDTEWSMTFQGKTVISMSKAQVLQMLYFNHTAHHRAQLGVYLRLLGISVPGTYGPSADEQ